MSTKPTSLRRGPLGRLLASLGPGVITGAADDDPSGIATYSIAGAQLGTTLLWTALLTWPLMAVVQMMCARIGMVTGQGLAGALRSKLPKWTLVVVALLLLAANSINVGADLAGMADAAEMLTGVSSHYFVLFFGASIGLATIFLPYHRLAGTLKWLTLSLFAYVITAFAVGIDWSSVLRDTLTPSVPRGSDGWAMIVAIFGTTISPYLFFWQASQEVEEEKFMGRQMLVSRLGATQKELGDRRVDVGLGTFFSNLIMFFIILTTAATLHRHGVTHIETSRQAAEALRPLAGRSRCDSVYRRDLGRRAAGDSYPHRLCRLRAGGNARLAGGVERAIWRREVLLWRRDLFDCARSLFGFCAGKPSPSAVPDSRDQWPTRAISIARHLAGCVGQQADAGPTRVCFVARRCRRNGVALMVLAAIGMFVF